MELRVPQLSLVLLVGPSGAGKSTFARRHFRQTEVLSSDWCRGLVSDDENDQSATTDAFELLHTIAATRLRRGHLTVVDATNVQREARAPLVKLARDHDVLPVAIVFDIPEKICLERNRERPDRDFGPHVVRNQTRQMRRSLRHLKKEGFRYIHRLGSLEAIEAARIVRQPLWNDKRDLHGPFDIIGDVHGCYDELVTLLGTLGYELGETADGPIARPPEGRTAVFVGDLVDRGPNTPGVLRLAMNMVERGHALCVPGNHDMKLLRALRGRDVQVTHGLDRSLEQLEAESDEFRQRATEFLDGLISHYVLDDGELVVAHAGMKEAYQGRGSRRVREFALYGETTGETDEFGLPVRYPWATEYRGRAMVVYGHTPVPDAEWLNNTINIDTGCVFGGRLTALRYPERELVAAPATQEHSPPVRPFLAEGQDGDVLTAQQRADAVLDIVDVTGKRIVQTALRGRVTVRAENAAAALEVVSRFAVDPKWLIYLPPTMSPGATSDRDRLLEHPAEAFAYFRQEGVPRVVCEEKHMGSRAVIVLARDEDAARTSFGVDAGARGIVYTRTGRRFFSDPELEAEVLARLEAAFEAADLWEALKTDWFCLDAEIMPWSLKAQSLIRDQYAAVGAAGSTALGDAVGAIEQAAAEGRAVELLERYRARADDIGAYRAAYAHYCWDAPSIREVRVAPFHIMASEGEVHVERDHAWHMETLARACAADPELLLETPFHVVDVTDPEQEGAVISWWEDRTADGGEGMVVKPLDFIANGRKGLAQPAIKVRGKEYLRIIYGPSYLEPENLARLRNRGLSHKRSLALREFALGVEGLRRFIRGEPLRRVHECVFAVLALESEPVDPRL